MKLNKNQLTTVMALFQWADKQKKAFLKELEGTPAVQAVLNPPADPKKKPNKKKAKKPKSPIDATAFKAAAKAVQRAYDIAKHDEAIGRGLKITEWLLAGEYEDVEDLADTREVLYASGNMLDSACASDIVGTNLFRGSDGRYYTASVEVVINEADDGFVQETLERLQIEEQEKEVEEALTGGVYDDSTELDAVTYDLCKHCDHFVEDVTEAGAAERVYTHLCDERHHNPDDAHAAEPRGTPKTLGEWKKDRPDLFTPFDDGSIGPNSRKFLTKLNAADSPTIPPAWEFPVGAEVKSDDGTKHVAFDATPWFVQASDDDLLKLAASNWGGDYAADSVAEHLESEAGYDEVSDALEYCRKITQAGGTCGFEVHVDAAKAREWVKTYRPDVFAKMETPYTEKPVELSAADVRRIAAEGRGTVTDDIADGEILQAWDEYGAWHLPTLKIELEENRRRLEEAGGRGVDLADRIDAMVMVVALREAGAVAVKETLETAALEENAVAAVDEFTTKAVSERAQTVASVAVGRPVSATELKAAWAEYGGDTADVIRAERDELKKHVGSQDSMFETIDEDLLLATIALAVREWIDKGDDTDAGNPGPAEPGVGEAPKGE